MKQERMQIEGVPAIIYGEKTDKIYLFVHGQDGNKEEAESFFDIVSEKGWQVLSIDLPGHGERKNEADNFYPCIAVPELQKIWSYMDSRWKHIALRANSIGAWYSMLAFRDKSVEKSLFVSPILDMEHLIDNMMKWAGVKEDELEAKKIIPTTFGQTLSWEYFLYARQHPIIKWSSETKILYGTLDNLTERYIVEDFARRFCCELTVMENGEHWFHTEEQLAVLNSWVNENG
jgi:pimeloyl-ACP methyl ester carboxylesterase